MSLAASIDENTSYFEIYLLLCFAAATRMTISFKYNTNILFIVHSEDSTWFTDAKYESLRLVG